MKQDVLSSRLPVSLETAPLRHHPRSAFVKGLAALAGSATVGYDLSVAPEPPPETTKLTLV